MQDLIGEIERARIHHKRDAERAKKVALFLAAGGREHKGATLLRQLHRGEAYAAGGRMDQHGLGAAQARQCMQRVIRGTENDGNRRGFGEGELWRNTPHGIRRYGPVRAKRSPRWREAHHTIADAKLPRPAADANDSPGQLVAEAHRLVFFQWVDASAFIRSRKLSPAAA